MTLEISHISKIYREKKALSDVSITFEPNKIYGLLGRNGAGKSTLLNIINNRSFPTSGTITLDKELMTDNETCLNRIYLMSEDDLYPNLKIKEIFKLSEKFYGSFDWKLATEMSQSFELDLKLTLRKLSTGYRSIAKLIIALSVPCDYVFLDEPVLGLDASHRELFYNFLIETYEKRPRSFVISTHLIEEIATLLEEIVVIEQGEVKVKSDVESLLQSNFALSGPKEAFNPFIEELHVIGSDKLGDYLTLYVSGRLPAELPDSISATPLTLQNYFIQLTKRK